MTLAEIRTEIWNDIGRPSNLDPSTDTSYSSGPYLTFVANEGQRRIAMWKAPNGRQLRFHQLLSEVMFQSQVITGSLTTATTTGLTFDSSMERNADQYEGWVAEITSGTQNGQRRIITAYAVDGSSTVHEAYTTAPAAADTYRCYKRFWYLLPSTHLWIADHITLPGEQDRYRAEGNYLQPLKIVDMAEQRVLERAAHTESYDATLTEYGDSSEWYRFGNKIYLDKNQRDEKWFRMEYYRLPTELSADADEPEIPEEFHFGIVLFGRWWGYQRQQELRSAWAAKQDFNEFMGTTKTELDVESERETASGEIEWSA